MPKTNEPPAVSRKLRLEDILDETELETTQNNKQYSRNDEKIAKNQQEYGQKKRIKPWRTGTKSQQQIVPKGFKKGFRG